MKSHDFGQFLFNSSAFSEVQLNDIIKKAGKSEPTLATAALFLQLIEAAELTRLDDEFVHTLITPRQAARALELKDGQSLSLAQALIDDGIVDYLNLDQLFKKYNKLEIPPIESALTAYYEKLKGYPDIDFPFAVDVISSFHTFLSETLKTTIIILPPSDCNHENQIGASVKIIGEIPVVVAMFANNEIFLRLAKRYDEYVETTEDAHDAISELLNVFTGHFTVKIAVTKGLEEVPEPPRYGSVANVKCITMLADIGTFYIYIGKAEIFD
ncbi:MAG: chemotaxis protein CheX [Selenomonadaceae bacterium]|nr:chemotaxis protein CheX [Selenomonadaceae bacterium]